MGIGLALAAARDNTALEAPQSFSVEISQEPRRATTSQPKIRCGRACALNPAEDNARYFLGRYKGHGTSDLTVPASEALHRGAAFGDLDRDGRVDMVVTRLTAPRWCGEISPRAPDIGLRVVQRTHRAFRTGRRATHRLPGSGLGVRRDSQPEGGARTTRNLDAGWVRSPQRY